MNTLIRPALVALLCLSVVGSLAIAGAARASASVAASAAVPFPSTLRGAPLSRAPRAGDFVYACNAALSADAGKVGGVSIPAGTAIEASTGCGVATLLLATPGAGRFQATYGVSDADTTGQPASVRVRVIGNDGSDTRLTQYTAVRGHPVSIDVDAGKASAVVLTFMGGPTTFVYGFHLGGSARPRAPLPSPGDLLPAGATPVDMTAAAYSCNVAKAVTTTPLTVTMVGLPTAGSFSGTGCGQVSVALGAGTHGTLALRYGLDDRSTGGAMTLSVRVLDGQGRLLRKAIGAPFAGSGLQSLWVDLSGARSVVLAIDGPAGSTLDVTALGILPRRLPLYHIPDHTISGGSPTGVAIIDPRAFVSTCNSSVGTGDTTIAGHMVFDGTYLSTYACGETSLVFCCTTARGSFHALFASSSSDVASPRIPTATVVVKNKDNKVLRRLTVHAPAGAPGVPIDISVNGASVLSLSFAGDTGILYDLRLAGTATIAQLFYPPTEPPVAVHGGAVVNLHDLSLTCNASIADSDMRLVGATTLEGWALSGTDCGQATLSLRGGTYPRHTFYARAGIAVGQPPDTVATLHVAVLGAGGRVVRAQDVVVRYGFGTLPIRISLAGGAAVQISWAHVHNLEAVVVYALTTT